MRDMPNLDLVRSLAVLSVIVEHYLLALNIQYLGPFAVGWFGVLGVMVFFVLTCIVLMWSLERRPHTADFYVRRIFRIYPLAWFAVAVAVLLHVPVGGTAAHFFAYTHVPPRLLARELTLLPVVPEESVTVMWSLPYEIGMYALLPVLFFFVRRNFALWPLLLLWAMTLFVNRVYSPLSIDFPTAIGYFLPGVMAYVAYARWKPVVPGIFLPLYIGLLWACFWYDASFHRCWYFCLLVGLGLPLFQQIRSAPVKAVSQVIARYSYGLYLSHPFAIAFGLYLFHGKPVAVQILLTLPWLVVLPVALYHGLEVPLIRVGSRLAVRVQAFADRHLMDTSLPQSM